MRRQSILALAIVLLITSSANADLSFIDLVTKVKPAVVVIQTFDKRNQPLGQGSGFIIDKQGYVITNYHVIEKAFAANILTSDGKKYRVKRIIAFDKDADLAKLMLDMKNISVQFLTLADELPTAGEDIAVIGNPLGLESTVSKGIVSAVREIERFGHIIQISAPISPGSSGSPVLNMKGQVIGVATFILKEGQALNFAVPSKKVMALEFLEKTVLLGQHIETKPKKQIPLSLAQKAYQNDNHGISIHFPDKWVVKYGLGQGTLVEALQIDDSNRIAMISLTVRPSNESNHISGLSGQDLFKNIKQQMRTVNKELDLTLLDCGVISHDRERATWVQYNTKKSGALDKICLTYLFRLGKNMLLDITASADHTIFPAVEQTMKECISTLEFDVSVSDIEEKQTIGDENVQPDVLPFAKAPFTAVQARRFQKNTAAYLNIPLEKTIDLGYDEEIEFVLIPAGEFTMGSPYSEEGRKNDEGPVRTSVKITKPFYMSKYEVTQTQYRAIMNKNPSYHTGISFPVDSVSWKNAEEFCNQVTCRLPTEAQWEYACRAGTMTPFNTGASINFEQANIGGFRLVDGKLVYGRGKTLPVGSFSANPFGLYDMHGNVVEWCSDYYDENYYSVSPGVNPQGPHFPPESHEARYKAHVFRGGSYHQASHLCRSANRSYKITDLPRRGSWPSMEICRGFRVVFRVNQGIEPIDPNAPKIPTFEQLRDKKKSF